MFYLYIPDAEFSAFPPSTSSGNAELNSPQRQRHPHLDTSFSSFPQHKGPQEEPGQNRNDETQVPSCVRSASSLPLWNRELYSECMEHREPNGDVLLLPYYIPVGFLTIVTGGHSPI